MNVERSARHRKVYTGTNQISLPICTLALNPQPNKMSAVTTKMASVYVCVCV